MTTAAPIPIASATYNESVDRFAELGYVLLPNLLSHQEADELSSGFEQFEGVAMEGLGRTINERQLLYDKKYFDVLFKPRYRETLRLLLGDNLQLLDVLGAERVETPTVPLRGWHLDWIFVSPTPIGVTSLFYLQDMTEDMGPLLLVPGSHLWQRAPRDDEREHPSLHEQTLLCSAGTAVVIHPNMWHSVSPIAAGNIRRTLNVSWTHHFVKRLDFFYRTPLPDYILSSEDQTVLETFGLAMPTRRQGGSSYNESYYG